MQRAAHLLEITQSPVEFARKRDKFLFRSIFDCNREFCRPLLDLGGQRIAQREEVGLVLREAPLIFGGARLQIGDDFLLAWPR